MKKLLGFIFLLSFSLMTSQGFAQTTVMRPAVAFVKADRSEMFIKQADSAVQEFDLATMVTQLTGGVVTIDSIRKLTIIGMDTSDGYILLGGNFYYLDPNSGSHVRYEGLVSVPWPLTVANFLAKQPTPIKFLLSASALNFRPVGVMSKDGREWWVNLQSYSMGQMIPKFYHGHTDGSGTIDSTTPVNIQGNNVLQEGVQFSNLALDQSNKTMLAMSFSGVQSSSQYTSFYIYFYRWQLGSDVEATNFTGSFKNTFVPVPTPAFPNPIVDSLFGMTVIPNNDGSTCLLGFTSDQNRDNSINLYQTQYGSGTINLSNHVGTIPRSILPSSQDFFSGENYGPYQEAVETYPDGQAGNAGDVTVNSVGGDSVLFITHESSGNGSDRNAQSAIYYYDYKTGGAGHLVYNDPNAQELQPVWVYMPYIVPQNPGIKWQGSPSTDFGTVDTGQTNTLTFTVVDTAKVSTIIDSVTISGANPNIFKLTPVSTPLILGPGLTQTFSVTFGPRSAGNKSAVLTVYFEGQNPSTLTLNLSGTGNIPQNSVPNDPVLSESMTTQPNPFASSIAVSLTAPTSGQMSIVVHDAVGRIVYRSDVREVGAGVTENFSFDAKSLGLPNGVYYVTAFLGDKQATREVVFTR